jgi:hypothetical protein
VTDAFEAWLVSLGGEVSADARSFIQQIFDEHGPVPRHEAVRIGRDRQLAFAREAVARVAHDVEATTTLEPPPFEYRDDQGSIRLACWGEYASSTIAGLTPAQVTVEVASFMQEAVMEDLHTVWPECRAHRTGLDASLSSDRAAWICRAGAHVVADIGRL